MRNSLALMLLAGACCLVFSQEAKADVNTITEVSYYAPTNSIFAWAETISDYDTLAYYEVGHWGVVFKDDTQISMFNAGSYDDNDAYNEEFFPYDPDADYTIEVYPQLVAKIRHNIGDTYEDYYDYVQWSYSDPVYHPYSFGFTGPGPDVPIEGNGISLGTVFSFFTNGGTAGPPHHLKIDNDKIDDPTTIPEICGQKERIITYQVVDQSGRSAGKTPRGETFPGTIISSCTGNAVNLTPCSSFSGGQFHPNYTDSKGKFKDHLRVGCPANSDNCGFTTTPDTWVWCKAPDYTSNRVPLARINYDVRKRNISVNGQNTPWPKGTEFFPDGSVHTP